MYSPAAFRGTALFLSEKTVEYSLVVLLALVPLIINPGAFDYWYRPKIETVFVVVMIAGAAWFIEALIRDRSFHWQGTPLTLPLLVYLASVSLSTTLSIDVERSLYGDPLRVEGMYTVVAYVALVFLFINLARGEGLQKRLVYATVIGATLVSLYALFQYLACDPTEHFFYKFWRRGPGVGSTIGNPNFLGKFLVLLIPIMLSLFLSFPSRLKTLLVGTSLTLSFAALVVTYTRASWLSLLCSLPVFLSISVRYSLLRGRTRRLIAALAIFALVVTFFNLYAPPAGTGRKGSFKAKETGGVVKRGVSAFHGSAARGIATRLYVWKKALHLIRERPWFGHGLETFELAFKRYNQEYTRYFNDYISVDRAHNNYIDTAFSLGLVGLAAYLAVIVTFLLYLSNGLRRTNDKNHRLLYTGILTGYCGYLINDLFIFSVVSVSPTFWSLMGLTVAGITLEGSRRE